MKIIDKYLGKTVIQSTLFTLLLLMGLSIFITLIKEISDVGTGQYGLLGALEYIFLDLPQQLYSFFPVACLIGVLLGLGQLANHHELIVLRISGVSLSRITFSVLQAMVILIILATFIGEVIAPNWEHLAETHKTLLTSNGQTLITKQGIWVRDGQNFLYISAVVGGHHLRGVDRYEFDKSGQLLSTSFAETGTYQGHGKWAMQNIAQSIISTQKVITNQIPQALWALSMNPDVLKSANIDPEEMSLKELYEYIIYLRMNHLSANSYWLTFWQRVLQPFAMLVMVWLAIPFVFGPLRSATMGLRIVLGALVGFGFITLNEFFGPISLVYQWPPLLAAALPILLFALAAWKLQKRVS